MQVRQWRAQLNAFPTCSAKWTIDETTCGKKGTEKYDFITQEMPIVVKAAQVTAAGFQGEFGNAYYELLMPASKRRLRGFPAALKQIFTNIANAADETSTFIDYKIKCKRPFYRRSYSINGAKTFAVQVITQVIRAKEG